VDNLGDESLQQAIAALLADIAKILDISQLEVPAQSVDPSLLLIVPSLFLSSLPRYSSSRCASNLCALGL
jgi:hypothetical protein